MRTVVFCWVIAFVCLLLGGGGLLWGSTGWGYVVLGLGGVFMVLFMVAMLLEMRTWKHLDWWW